MIDNGNGGWDFETCYNLPVDKRKYYAKKISDRIAKQNASATGENSNINSKPQLVKGPNIKKPG